MLSPKALQINQGKPYSLWKRAEIQSRISLIHLFQAWNKVFARPPTRFSRATSNLWNPSISQSRHIKQALSLQGWIAPGKCHYFSMWNIPHDSTHTYTKTLWEVAGPNEYTNTHLPIDQTKKPDKQTNKIFKYYEKLSNFKNYKEQSLLFPTTQADLILHTILQNCQ